MSRPQVKEHNATTDEIIVRDMTDAELEALETLNAEIEAAKEAAKQKELDRKNAEAKLQALGLTADDLKALGLG